MKDRMLLAAYIVGDLIWRGFGAFLWILGGSGTMGALVTHDPFTGILIAWGTLMIGVIGAIGYAIAITGKVAKSTVPNAMKDALQKWQENHTK